MLLLAYIWSHIFIYSNYSGVLWSILHSSGFPCSSVPPDIFIYSNYSGVLWSILHASGFPCSSVPPDIFIYSNYSGVLWSILHSSGFPCSSVPPDIPSSRPPHVSGPSPAFPVPSSVSSCDLPTCAAHLTTPDSAGPLPVILSTQSRTLLTIEIINGILWDAVAYQHVLCPVTGGSQVQIYIIPLHIELEQDAHPQLPVKKTAGNYLTQIISDGHHHQQIINFHFLE